MATPRDSKSERLNSRSKSLRYNNDSEKPDIPAYLKAVSPKEEEAAIASALPESGTSNYSNTLLSQDERITITMGRTTVISILIGSAMMGLCFFAAGFLVSYAFFPQTIEQKKQAPAAEKKEAAVAETSTSLPEPAEEGDRLAQMAQNITSQLAESNVPGAAAVNDATGQAIEVKSSATNLKDEVKNLKGETEKTTQAVTTTLARPSLDSTAPSPFYTVEIGQTDSKTQAESMRSELEKLKIPAFIGTKTNIESRTNYVINAGNFKTYAEAKTYLTKLPKPYALWGKVTMTQGNSKESGS